MWERRSTGNNFGRRTDTEEGWGVEERQCVVEMETQICRVCRGEPGTRKWGRKKVFIQVNCLVSLVEGKSGQKKASKRKTKGRKNGKRGKWKERGNASENQDRDKKDENLEEDRNRSNQ